MYGQVFSDLNEALKKFKTHEATTGTPLQFFETLIWQTGLLVGFRSELVSMYRALAASRGSPQYSEFIKHLSMIKKQISLGVNHSLLENVKVNVMTEVTALRDLFKAQVAISLYNFMDASLTLYKCKMELEKWKKFYTELAGGESKVPKNGVVPWLHKLHASLHSKMTFYFYPILCKNETRLGGTMKTFTAKLTVDYHALVLDFCQRSGCFNVSFILDQSYCQQHSTTPNNTTTFVGYDCNIEPVRRMGLASWPAIMTLPQPPVEHWPNLISLIMGNPDHLSKYKEPLFCYDELVNSTYFFSMVEPSITMVVIYNRKKAKNDQLTQEFMYIMSTNLRNWKIFSLLKPKT